MFDALGWLTVKQLISYHTLLTIFKMRASGEPEYLEQLLTDDNRTGRIVRTNTDLSLTMKSFTFRGCGTNFPATSETLVKFELLKISRSSFGGEKNHIFFDVCILFLKKRSKPTNLG